MKKALSIVAVSVALATSFSAAAFCQETESEFFPTYEQTASAWLDQGENEVKVTVDLTGGWSAEFAHGAVYLYDGEIDLNNEAIALGLTLDEAAFNEYVKGAPDQDNYREFAHSFSYTDEDGWSYYFFSVGPDAYFMIQVNPDADGDAVSSRISVEPSDYVEDSVGE